jgi:hypothetical protein
MKAEGMEGVQRWFAPLLSPQQMGLQQIDDPMVAQQAPAGGSGGTSEPQQVLNQAAVGATQQAIDSLGTEQEVGYGNIEDSYGSLVGRYDKERTRNREDYEEEGVTNNQNLLKNKQNALLAAAQGRRGLRGTLAAIGALSGTGSELADRAVQTSANQDIGEASETFAGNATTLDKAWDRFDEEDEDRRAEAGTARKNQRTALEGEIAGKRQNYFQKMAELFAEGGDTAAAAEWLGRAGGLNDVIANKTRVGATPFTARGAAFTPGDLESYLAGAGDMTVDVRSGGTGGAGGPTTLLAGRQKKREREEALV